MAETSPLVLDAMIVTGNTKAAVKAAGGGSSDLWTVPPDQIHYDPRDNVRPLDQDRVRHLAALMKANGYDRKKPLGCFVRKVGGEDRIFVYEGQHRYHAALLAIKEGGFAKDKEIDRLPVVIDEAKSVNRVNLIYAGITNNDGEKLTPLQLAEKVIELQDLGEPNASICKRLNITDQTIRDVLLLAHAPAGLHKLVRDKIVSSTLAIEEVRAHGGEKALERMLNAASKANASGKVKVTKKVLDASAPKETSKKITDPQAKQLLQALQSVLHDPVFGKLSPGTIEAVHTALTPLADLLDARSLATKTPALPGLDNRQFRELKGRLCPKGVTADIRIARVDRARYVMATTIVLPGEGRSGPLSAADAKSGFSWAEPEHALAAGVRSIRKYLKTEANNARNGKERAAVSKWLDGLCAAEPDIGRAVGEQTASERAGMAAWPFSTGGRP
ncbi:ParB/RepB/Spo0J family partition protein [Paraburkholderia dilworthii]|uniref:ParB/RepB/Spo0J family partition protein n=1 Tax=Paraburkholderia dilworthii TaxID=948106 RepID=A0ABW9DAP2_9BURK